ncbi:MAG: AmmeMemoRadiSam system protein B [Planctomycetota bacterium]|nr:MAG: AmmeMemoRadiSam system protein B [Planctomycetota bacterium]
MLPKLRTDLQFIPASTEDGTPVMVIQDPLGLMEKALILPQASLLILQVMEKSSSIEEVQEQLIRLQDGVFISKETIQNLIDELDQSYLLNTEKYQQALQAIVDEFAQKSLRLPYCAGSSYPEDKEEVEKFLDQILHSTPKLELPETDSAPPLALVSPHIDLRVGGKAYAAAYHSIRDFEPQLVVILGVGHQMLEGYFCLTQKEFQTPLGTTPVAKDLVERLLRPGFSALTPHDFYHKQEHSIEFQVLFLQYIYSHSFEILPILVGSFHRELADHSRPQEIPGVGDFLGHLKELLASYPKDSVLLLAGVDLSHVGLKFGDGQSAHAILPEAEEHDKAFLEYLCQNNLAELWKHVQKVEDKFHLCGFHALSCLLELLPSSTRGTLLHYEIWREEPTQSAVSYASVLFT